MTASLTATGRVAQAPQATVVIQGERAGTPFAFTRLAVHVPDSSRDAPAGRRETLWLRLVGFDAVAGVIEGLRKGDQVRVAGTLRWNAFTGRDGVQRGSWECLAESVERVGKAKDTDAGTG